MKRGCWQCHGTEGQGAVTGAKLAPDPKPLSFLQVFVRNSNGPMPPYPKAILTDEELARGKGQVRGGLVLRRVARDVDEGRAEGQDGFDGPLEARDVPAPARRDDLDRDEGPVRPREPLRDLHARILAEPPVITESSRPAGGPITRRLER